MYTRSVEVLLFLRLRVKVLATLATLAARAVLVHRERRGGDLHAHAHELARGDPHALGLDANRAFGGARPRADSRDVFTCVFVFVVAWKTNDGPSAVSEPLKI